MPHLDINELHKERDKRNSIRSEIYNRILQRCHSKIKSISKLSDICCCFFEVPAYDYGLPAYNQIECVYYIIQQLMDDGFKVEFAEPNILFITWYNKPKKKSLSDIARDTRLPLHHEPKRTQNFNVGNSLYHDGLSELEVKSNQIFKDDLFKDNYKDHNKIHIHNRGINNSRPIKQPMTREERMNRLGENKKLGFTRENRTLVDFNPNNNNLLNDSSESDFNGNDYGMPRNTNFKTFDNTKTLSFDINPSNGKKTAPKTQKFRSLYDDDTRDTSYKKMSRINPLDGLADLDDDYDFNNNHPISASNNNSIGFTPF